MVNWRSSWGLKGHENLLTSSQRTSMNSNENMLLLLLSDELKHNSNG